MSSDGATYIAFRDRSKPDILAVFNNWPAHAGKVDIHIDTIVHPHLSARNHHNCVPDVGDVSCSCDLPSHNKRVRYVFQCQAGEGLSVGS
jgi:hypothetical protein